MNSVFKLEFEWQIKDNSVLSSLYEIKVGKRKLAVVDCSEKPSNNNLNEAFVGSLGYFP